MGAPSPRPMTPSCRSSTHRTSLTSSVPRAITKGSAVVTVPILALRSTGKPYASTLTAPRAPVAQGIERAPPEREVGGSNPPGRILPAVRSYLKSLDPRLPRDVYVLQAGGLLNAFGTGVVLPFLLIYLHNVRGISLGVAGLAAATQSAAALASG